MQYMQLLVLLAAAAFALLRLAAAAAASGVVPSAPAESAQRSGCQSTGMCGNVEIPFPFSISQDCALPAATGSGNFTITCNHSFNPPKPFIGNIEVLTISLEAGQMVVRNSFIASICYNSTYTTCSNSETYTNLVPPYLISPTSNEFTAIGCDTAAYMANHDKVLRYFSGCISYCASVDEAAEDGDDCAGLGCCKADIAANLSSTAVYWGNANATRPNSAWEYSPCSYAFVAKKGWYNFSRQDLTSQVNNSFMSRVGNETLPLVLDWGIRGGGSCVNVSGNLKGPACVSNNSTCVNTTDGDGYLCNCATGYTGNPYVPGGCTNINECENNKNPCTHSTCKDTDGGFKCHCYFNRKGDGKSVRGCDEYIIPPYAIAVIATFVAVVTACFSFFLLQIQKHRKLFNINGGDVLKGVAISIFTERELKKITNGYSDRIGGGFFGDVYKGIIKEANQTKHVAVKCTVAKKEARRRQKELQGDAPQHEQEESWKEGFVKEITFQFRNKHPNMVCLIGCCLETDIPILVFEFVSNGSLDKKLHGANCTLSLQQRLNIAIGSAEALFHMHSHGEYNHVHGDIKPANILLDEDLNAKVSDFGSSKLLSGKTYAEGVVADGNYLDPYYVKEGQFTDKSDVYSFGVVLLELITRKTARYNGNSSLPAVFENCWKDEVKRRSLYDTDILSNNQLLINCLDMVGELALECLNADDPVKRPTMGEVVGELKNVRSIASGGSCCEASETEPLLDETLVELAS